MGCERVGELAKGGAVSNNANRRIPVSHKYPPGDLNPGPLFTGSKHVVHWTVRHGENEVRLQALHRAPPQQPTPLVVKPEGRPAASVKPGRESCVRSSGIIALSVRELSARRRSASEEATMINQVRVTNVAGLR